MIRKGLARRLVFFDTEGGRKRVSSDKEVEAKLIGIEHRIQSVKQFSDNEKLSAHVMGIIENEKKQKSYVGKRSFCRATRILSKVGDIDNCLLLLRMQRGMGMVPFPETYDWIISAFTKSKRHSAFEEAMALFAKFRKEGYKMSRKSYVNIIKLHSKKGDFDGAKRAANDMKAAGHELSIDGHNALLLGCSNYTQLTEITESMRINDIPRTPPSLNLMMRVCLLMKDPINARKVFDLIKNEGFPITIRHYTMLISIYTVCDDIRGVSDTYNEIIMSGIPPDNYCLKTIIESLSRWATDEDCDVTHLAESITSNGIIGSNIKQAETLRCSLMKVYTKVGAVDKLKNLISRTTTRRPELYEQLLKEATENKQKAAARGFP
eukprot:TRINITY_DN2367_c0_g1_i1.p2 TRINITY_DN2367_c0_g1~~TRINITY_DN2367_c0_g1_i1.p2  ORF type:complete len:378 (+),score=80.23 TRINITY_DN2367_c0_g1_i1:79-1212(+)